MSKSNRKGLPKYESKEALEGIIQDYFKKCRREVLRDEYGSVVYQKNGEPTLVGVQPPTVAGLAFALGFLSRQDFLNYKGKFSETIARARLMLEGYAEARLYDKDGLHGAKFTLTNNFQGWADKTKEE
ncbi:terminase small subunit [Anaerotignum sp. MB30-C6]|uniref:terminase small subunit n=1 Tax=Anaerotignum sp. MB30-C6 TaxID=3070814 RepID=UPI0027DCC8C5|nr:terminase small subunit [Anaerotignum sp. MB30-C6]WMI80361.1 terminase small subunit [Anaerotignum sp. MB30-C6]